MPKQFLKQVAEHYYNRGEVERCCFIFPNRRSIAFFSKYLSEAVKGADKPIIAPAMFTVNDFFYKISGKRSIDRVTQLIELYQAYVEVFCAHNRNEGLKPESLDEFIFWGEVILADFNDVDKYLVDPKQLFANVSDFKQLQDTFSYLTETQRKAIEGFVSHFKDKNGDVKERFLMLWNLLYDLYRKFNERLSEKGLAYEGMVYRSLADKLNSIPVADVLSGNFDSSVKFVFVGLNALNECEKTLLRKLNTAEMAEFCWDYSGQMISDPQNRSSVFLAENVKEFKQAEEWDADGLKTPNINVVSVPSSVGQAKRLPDILRSVLSSTDGTQFRPEELVDCAIVLPDENLLIPVLNSIPEEIQDINVTMGLPMRGSLLYSLMSQIATIQLHTVQRGGQWYFYHKQVWDLFSNDLFRKSADQQTLEIISKVKADAKYYIPQSELLGTKVMDAIFQAVIKDHKEASVEQIREFAEYQKSVITTLAPAVAEDPSLALELEYAKEYYRCVNVLEDVEGLSVVDSLARTFAGKDSLPRVEVDTWQETSKAVYLRSNLLCPLMHVGVEFPLGRAYSLGFDYAYPWLMRRPDHRNCFQMLAWSMEGRYWWAADGSMSGHSLGLDLGVAYYDVERQFQGRQGELLSLAAVYRYAWPIFNERWHLHVGLSLGYVFSVARPYDVFVSGGKAYRRAYTQRWQYLGPTECEIALVLPIKWRKVL